MGTDSLSRRSAAAESVDHFEAAFARTVGIEGDYSNDPMDSGGATRFGITEIVARANGYDGDMRSLPFTTARDIYRSQYWNLLKLYDVANLSPPVAEELFDSGVNLGTGVAACWLQRALNALNDRGTRWPDIAADGAIGNVTLFALRAFLIQRGAQGQTVLLRALNSLQGARYIELAEARPKDERFVYGWFSERVEIDA